MPIAPGGSTITFSGSAVATMYVDSVEYEFVVEPFERLEYSNSKLREAPTSSGAKPMIVTTFGNKPIQLASSCTGDSARPLTPDDSNINSIKQQWNIQRYTLGGAATLSTAIDTIFSTAQDHSKRLSKFQLHLEKAQMDLSYSTLVTMQSETFSYITATGLDVAGTSLGGSLSDVLITEFRPGVLYTITSSGTLVHDWSMTLEVRTISDRVS